MKSIQTKFLGPTDTKSARIKASAEGVPSKVWTVNSLHDLRLGSGANPRNIHEVAAAKFCEERGWPTGLASGGTKNPDVWVHCFIPESSAKRLALTDALITAAPDLLEALEGLLDITQDIVPLGSFGNKARAAIAKATGQES